MFKHVRVHVRQTCSPSTNMFVCDKQVRAQLKLISARQDERRVAALGDGSGGRDVYCDFIDSICFLIDSIF